MLDSLKYKYLNYNLIAQKKGPILRGRDIKRYSYEFANLYVIFIPRHFPLQNDNSIQGASERAENLFKEKYPAIYDHLIKYKEQLSLRNTAETGIRYERYALQRRGAKYWEDFYKPKIVYQELSQGSAFCLDKDGDFMISNTAYLITGNRLDYLIKRLNSKIIEKIFKLFYATQLGGKGIRWLSQCIVELPIPQYKNEDKYNMILKSENCDSIDNLICSILGLSEDEREYLEID